LICSSVRQKKACFSGLFYCPVPRQDRALITRVFCQAAGQINDAQPSGRCITAGRIVVPQRFGLGINERARRHRGMLSEKL
jgi:hypothetical protein